jgi:putative DNA primase/helicase
MPHLYDNIPRLLKSRPNWVAWGVPDAPPKSPFNPASLLNGRASPAKAGIPDTWGDYETAALCVERGLAKGVGYEFDGGGLYGVDLDHVVGDGGALTPQAERVARELASYAETSPSGTGLHVFVLAPGARITRHRKKGCFLEIYNAGRYFTVTGDVRGGAASIETRTAELQAVHDEFLSPEAERRASRRPPPPAPPQGVGRGGFLRIGLERDKVLLSLWNGERRHGNESADDQALMNKLAYWCDADPDAMIRAFLGSPHHAQKDEAHRRKCLRPDYLAATARDAIDTAHSTATAEYERWRRNRDREGGPPHETARRP